MATIFSIFGKSKGLEEIIFQDRNKEYGAYALRKAENSSLNKSSLITLGVVSIVCLLLIHKGNHAVVQQPADTVSVVANFISPKIEIPVIKIPEVPDFIKQLKRSDFTNPIVVEELTDPKLTATIPPDYTEIVGESGTAGDIGQENPLESPIPVQTNNFFYNIPEMPTFNGGDLIEFSNWVQRNIIYPDAAMDRDLEGRIITEFIIGKKGQIEEIKILRGIDPLLDNEALRVLKLSPLWKPGKQNGDPVRVKLVLPIIFKLSR